MRINGTAKRSATIQAYFESASVVQVKQDVL